ncbi:MFS transporter [Clostridium aestuarii]|uniref:MFS transporter n=1 Tax=Clostridium aestuarii TaxID=338193 RepID=A0ABT4D6L6_9CLOT|nr:MFS transporter [Clostridium aestuarii]MCY6485648.1 MFS transporter [Clostridium aestuarii]
MNKKLSTITTITFIFSVTFLVSVCDNLRGPYAPSIKYFFSANDTQIGFMFIICSLGYMIFSYICGILCEKFDHKLIIYIGFIICIFSIIKICIGSNFTDFLIGMFFLNAGEAFIIISFNTLVSLMNISFKAVIINLMHFSYGFGAAFIQKKSGFLLSNNISFIYVHFILAILFLVALIKFVTINIPNFKNTKLTNSINNKIIFKNKLLYFYMLSLGLYMAAETATSNWLFTFMKGAYSYDENTSSFYLSLFFILLSLGRIIGGYIAEKFGYVKTSFISLFIGFFLYTTGYILRENGIILISISGLFFSIVFPTMLLNIKYTFNKNISYITSIIISFSSVCCISINFLIGTLSDFIGIYKAFYSVPVCLFISSVFLFFIYTSK